ncbi:peptidoglycan editing factor PgeF [soil metagenome]
MVHVATDRDHGDLAPRAGGPALQQRREAVNSAPWTWLNQVHGATVVRVTRPGEHAGAAADAAVTAVRGVPISVQTADCAPVLLWADDAVGVAHAGWRGLMAGVIEATAAAMAALGHAPKGAVLGPCIRPRCYEFGADELEEVVRRYGPEVAATTGWATPALDLAAAVVAACSSIGLELVDDGTCTACSPRHWSHRAGGDPQRQALVAWLR